VRCVLPRGILAHAVGGLALDLAVDIGGLKAVLDGDVEVAAVLLVGLDGQGAGDFLALLDGEDVLEVEDGLLPVRVLGVGTGREADGLVGGGELNVEPRDNGVDEVVPPGGQGEVGDEVEVRDLALVEVQGQDGGGLGDDSLDLDGVDEGLGESDLLEGSVVEAVDVVPDCGRIRRGLLHGGVAGQCLHPIFSSL
jgi:hypothetical protein